MIGWLMGLGLSRRASMAALIALGAVLVLGAFYFALDAYGDSRYREGSAAADAAWREASDKLIEQAHKSADKADVAAAARASDYAAKVEDEKERIDAAKASGSSPFDVLFNANGG